MFRPSLDAATISRRVLRSGLATIAVACVLAACGGGGGDVVPTAAEDDDAVAAQALAAGTAGTAAAAAPYDLDVSTSRVPVLQGHRVAIDLTLNRRQGFDGAVRVSLRGLPAGVRASALTLPAGATQARVVLRAAADAPHSLPTRVSVRAVDADRRLATASIVVTVRGPAGSVDTSFGGGPVVTRVGDGEDYAQALAVQADGKVILAGSTVRPTSGTDAALVRYRRDGGLDPTFGTRGRLVAALATGGGSDRATAVAVQPDGRIVVAGDADMGASREDFALARFLPDGRPDRSFGRRGKVTTGFAGDSSDRVQALVIQPDGKIVVGGLTYGGPATHLDFALVRYLPDGRLDTSFGEGGKVVTPAADGAGSDGINALALQEVDGEPCIVAVGGEGGFVIARYRSDGTLDRRFGAGGIVRGLFPQYIGAARAVTTAPGGRLIVAGHIDHDFAAVRLLNDGTLDTSFHGDGRVIVPVAADNWDEATAVVRQPDGRILLGGWTYPGAGSAAQFAALRLTADGERDRSFGADGLVVPPVAAANRSASGRALVLQADRRVPTVRALQGGERNDANNDFALLRYWL